MYYIVYETKNTISNKVYIGVHQTENLDDGYIGSGKVLKRAVAKHGFENFARTVLHCFDNPDDMFAKEREIVDQAFVDRRDTYNVKIGGCGGFDFINRNGIKAVMPPEYYKDIGKMGHERIRWLLANDQSFADQWSARCRRASAGNKSMLGRKHTEQALEKMREAKKGKGGSAGAVWVHNGEVNARIKLDELAAYLKRGYAKGRIVSDKVKEQLSRIGSKGKVWITKDGKSTMIHRDLLPRYLEDGYTKGRIAPFGCSPKDRRRTD